MDLATRTLKPWRLLLYVSPLAVLLLLLPSLTKSARIVAAPFFKTTT